jgi:hypothetical protein
MGTINANMLDQMAQDAELLALPRDEQLRQLSAKVESMQHKAQRIADLEAQLEDAKKEHLELERKVIPEMLAQLGLAELRLKNPDGTPGKKLTVKTEYYASISTRDLQKKILALKWLRDHGHDGIIKHAIACNFGKGEDLRAQKLMVLLRENGYTFEDSETVHPQTLKAFVREQIEKELGAVDPAKLDPNSVSIPFETFNIQVVSVAKLK